MQNIWCMNQRHQHYNCEIRHIISLHANFSCGGKKLMSLHNEGFSVEPIEIVMWHIWKKNHQLWNRYHHNQPS
jgi:hypothetical protein